MMAAMLNCCLNASSDCSYTNLWWRLAVLSAMLTHCIPPVRPTADDQRFAKTLFSENSVSQRCQHPFNASSVKSNVLFLASFALFVVLSILVLCCTIFIRLYGSTQYLWGALRYTVFIGSIVYRVYIGSVVVHSIYWQYCGTQYLLVLLRYRVCIGSIVVTVFIGSIVVRNIYWLYCDTEYVLVVLWYIVFIGSIVVHSIYWQYCGTQYLLVALQHRVCIGSIVVHIIDGSIVVHSIDGSCGKQY